jgi:hypothetical protein
MNDFSRPLISIIYLNLLYFLVAACVFDNQSIFQNISFIWVKNLNFWLSSELYWEQYHVAGNIYENA